MVYVLGKPSIDWLYPKPYTMVISLLNELFDHQRGVQIITRWTPTRRLK